jgi:transcriptional regulator with XRE-family HTH domain
LQRLKSAIAVNFGTQSHFAKILEMSHATVNQVLHGKRKLTEEVLAKIQDKAGIRKDYIQKGELPMLVPDAKPDKPYEVRYPSPEFSLKKQAEYKDKTRGICRQIQLTETGSGIQMLVDNGTANIVDTALDGIEDPIVLTFNAPNFCLNYKLAGASIVLAEQENYEEKHTVFAECKGGFRLLIILGVDNLLDRTDNKTFTFADVRIIGRAYSMICYF